MMTESLVNISGLGKRYGSQLALNQVRFTVDRGEICGLVGENGAGKTTLLRILSDLILPTEGEVSYTKTPRVGALIEAPALYPHLSARDNLLYVGKQLGLADLDKQVDQVLDLVGLADVSKRKKAKHFSLGMRQRLAIGMAILDFPDFLILDEPINGLDPVGIKEVRELLHRLRDDYQMTILISSHILSELELVADKFVIMYQGEILEVDRPVGLREKMQSKVYLSTTDNSAVAASLTERGISHELVEDYIHLDESVSSMTLFRIVDSLGLEVKEVFHKTSSFEQYYLDLIGGKGHGQSI